MQTPRSGRPSGACAPGPRPSGCASSRPTGGPCSRGRWNVLHRGAGEHLAGQVEHDDGCREALRHCASSALVCGLCSRSCRCLRNGYPSTCTLVEGEPEVLGERALARAVEPRHPDADLVLAARLHRRLHAVEQLPELLLDALGDDVLGDLGLQALLLRRAVGDDLLDRAVDVLAGSKSDRMVIGCSQVPFIGLSRRRGRSGSCRPRGRSPGTSAGSCLCARRGRGRRSARGIAVQLALDRADAQIWVQRFQVGHQEQGVRLPSRGLSASSRRGASPAASNDVG